MAGENDNVNNMIATLQNEDEAAISFQVTKAGLCRTDYKIPEGAGVNADDLAFMTANMVKAMNDIVSMVRKDIETQGQVAPELFDAVLKKYLAPPEEELPPRA